MKSSHSENSLQVVSGTKRVLYLVFAGLTFVLGFLGALLPVLPATPFLLLTSFFLVRSSPRLNARLRRSRVFGPILTDWEDHGGVRRHVKIQAVIVVVASVFATIVLTEFLFWQDVVIGILAGIGVFVIVKLPEAEVGNRSDEC